jgi:hypothetical protein
MQIDLGTLVVIVALGADPGLDRLGRVGGRDPRRGAAAPTS